MATGISANKLELVQIADAVAREKGIDIEIVWQPWQMPFKKRQGALRRGK